MPNTDFSTLLRCGVAALLIASPIGLGAQQTSQETTPTPTETPAETPAEATEAPATEAPSDLDLGEEVATEQGNPLGTVYLKETVGDWQLRCLRTETTENDPCQMYQLLIDESNAPVAEFNIFRLPDGGKAAAGATVTVPLETDLTRQLTIQVDNGASKRYPFAYCTTVGCHARIGLTPEDVAAYKAGKVANVTIVPAVAPDQQVKLNVSLTGFTAAYGKVSVIQQ